MPEPLLPLAITAHSAGDEDKLGTALARVVAEDPTLRVAHPEDTGQIVLWTLGEAHADLVLDRLRSRYGVEVDSAELRASLRETFSSGGSGNGRLVKQSGGHGQYAVVDITVEPLPAGGGFEFVDKIVGGVIPREYIKSIDAGIRETLDTGIYAGFPMVDVRVTLFDGSYHEVDSSEMAFKIAGSMAVKDAVEKASPTVLEPVMRVEVTMPEEFMGDVIGDLNSRRGQIEGMDPRGSTQVVRSAVPLAEMFGYATDLQIGRAHV